MTGRIALFQPDVGPLEESFLLRAFRSGWPGPAGPETEAFEAEIAGRAGVRHAVGVNSGTAALHLALLACGAGPGTVVVVPTLTFAATANAAVYTGARPVFIDSDPATGNVDPDLLADLLDRLAAAGTRVAAVMSVDLNGTCADYSRLRPICRAAGVPLVEDAAQALGSTRQGEPAGSFGELGTFSFSWNKVITTSAGGMVVTDDAALAARCRHLSTQAREPVTHYEHRDVGYNYRLSNLLAAVGRAQLRRLDEMIERRRLAQRGIETRPMWKPMHRQPVFAGHDAVVTGVADRLFARSISLPSGSSLTDADTDRLVEVLEEFLEERG
ncbi:DegT/DnrJ/EryC1/StrS family aminotransferase [Micromonospora sp. DH15]|nr:DegT/DnrJ/EryC1/StrS family aminotransferase [Micromonospora sp. DH15]